MSVKTEKQEVKPRELGELIPLILCAILALQILFAFRGKKRIVSNSKQLSLTKKNNTLVYYYAHKKISKAQNLVS